VTQGGPPPVSVAADRELLERILRDSRVEQALPGPSLAEYVETVWGAALEWLEGSLRPLETVLGSRTFEGLVWVFAASVIVVLTAGLVRLLARRRPVVAAVVTAVTPAPPRGEERGPDAWRAALDERLRRGDVTGALEALWWWLARSLAGSRADPAWTSRELLGVAGRTDLTRHAQELDRMIYGARRPSAGEVRGLLGRLEQAIA
jgi:hypothetical protein